MNVNQTMLIAALTPLLDAKDADMQGQLAQLLNSIDPSTLDPTTAGHLAGLRALRGQAADVLRTVISNTIDDLKSGGTDVPAPSSNPAQSRARAGRPPSPYVEKPLMTETQRHIAQAFHQPTCDLSGFSESGVKRLRNGGLQFSHIAGHYVRQEARRRRQR